MDMTKRDNIILKKILGNQKILADTMKEFRVSTSKDLGSIHYVMRRGMVQIVGDIYELLAPLDDEIQKLLPLNKPLIKQFRDTASHNYGVISDEMAYACIKHCIDKKFVDEVRKLLESPKAEQEQPEATS